MRSSCQADPAVPKRVLIAKAVSRAFQMVMSVTVLLTSCNKPLGRQLDEKAFSTLSGRYIHQRTARETLLSHTENHEELVKKTSLEEIIKSIRNPGMFTCPDTGLKYRVNPALEKWVHPIDFKTDVAIYCVSPVKYQGTDLYAGVSFGGQFLRLEQPPAW
jgi:hypothetical protein